MGNKSRIQKELVRFKQKYWLAKLIQGLLIFIGSGIAFALIAVGIEYTAWLAPSQRQALFIVTLFVEIGLFVYYVGLPAFQFLTQGKGLSDKEAAAIIGGSVSGVDDVLENWLELQDLGDSDDLVKASINQKDRMLVSYDFLKAVQWSSLRPFLAFLLVPMLLLAFLLSEQGRNVIFQGGERLVNYSVVYEKTLPFLLELEQELKVDEGQDLTLYINTVGNVKPEALYITSVKGKQELEQISPTKFRKVFRNCTENLTFRFEYDDILSAVYSLEVIKKPVIGRSHIEIIPPEYTNLNSYSVDNSRSVQVPEGSDVRVNYIFKNINQLKVWGTTFASDSFDVYSGKDVTFSIEKPITLLAYGNRRLLNKIDFDVIKDNPPKLDVRLDSALEGIIFDINANDDYSIVSALSVVTLNNGEESTIKLTPNQTILKSRLFFSYDELKDMKRLRFTVRDFKQSRSKEFDLTAFKEKTYTNEELLAQAGESIDELRNEESSKTKAGSKATSLEKTLKEKKEKARKLEETAKELSKKDSTEFRRFEKLSEEINKLLEKLEKDIPKIQEEMLQKQLEEQIEQLEQEWMILKVIDQLKQLDDSLEAKPFVDEEQMQKINESSEELEKKLDTEKKNKVSWEKFEDLQNNNESLSKENKNQGENSANDQDKKKKSQDDSNDSMQQTSPKDQMKEDSDELKKELSSISAAMMMETMQKNIELLRRLEIRSLKASKKQEEVYLKTVDQNEYNRALVLAQKEITQSAQNVLDSLSALLVSDPMLEQVLLENKQLLNEHIGEMAGLPEMTQSNRLSSQRYLQYSLNDLASILYDILKSESQAMQNMMAGNKACNKPKPGNGKKGSISKKQKELGEKMGNMKKPGKGKSGQQTMGKGELLELIKGQEEAISEYKQKGGSKAGDDAVLDEMNKQLDDLINNNIDKAIERNKSIEDKLIAIERSENQKREEKEKRQSKENEVEYERMKETALENYLRSNQRSTGVVNLPALKNYFTGKWIIINQQ